MRTTPFLAQIAQQVISQYHTDASQLTLIFPNKRSGLFFRKYLEQQLEKPMFLPQILEIDDFVGRIANTNRPDELQLVAWLYEVFNQVMSGGNQDKVESFSDFYQWGQMMLADFVELDKQLVDPKNLFTTIQDQKELDSFYGDLLTTAQKLEISTIWSNISNAKSSAQKDRFMRIWLALPVIYDKLHHKLSRLGYATEGFQYREAVSKAKDWLAKDPDRTYWIIGINDLTKSEERIVAQMVEAKHTTIFWDTDQELVRPKAWLEAGLFHRRYMVHPVLADTFSPNLPNHLVPALGTELKPNSTSNVNINQHSSQILADDPTYTPVIPVVTATSVSLVVGQSKLLAQILADQMAKVDDQSKVAILLPDPGMLFTVLNSLPKVVMQQDAAGQLVETPLLVNVSMGYPFRQTPLYSLLYHLIECQKSARVVHGKPAFYHDFVLAVVQHPYIVVGHGAMVNEIVQAITSQNLINVPAELLAQWEIGKVLFQQPASTEAIFDYLNNVLSYLSRQLLGRNPDNPTLEDEYLYRAITTLNRFKEVVTNATIVLELDLFWQMLRQLLDEIKLPFAGEPLEGLQILGMLESRNLDFESVIILGANEGLMPKSSAHGSFIPYNLRRTFGLTTNQEQDAAQAYLFYRLLFSAKQVNLLYNAESTEQIKGEPTRYFYQLLYGLQWPVRQQVLASKVQQLPIQPISIPITLIIRDKIRERFTDHGEGVKTLDPSAIATLIDCKLKFYLRQVAQVYGSDSVSEEAQTNAVGQLLHHSMEWLYLQLRDHKNGNKTVQQQDCDWLTDQVDEALNHALAIEKYPLLTDLRGQLLIITQVVKQYILRLLDLDAQYAPFEVLELETESRQDPWLLTADTPEGPAEFRLGGRIDRIDRKADTIRIIDYKTGKALQRADSLLQVFGKDQKVRQLSAMYQIMHYTMLFARRHPDLALTHQLTSGILSLRNCFADNYDVNLSPLVYIGKDNPINDFNQQYATDFEAQTQALLTDLMAEDMVFDQTTELATCTYCDYKTLCQR